MAGGPPSASSSLTPPSFSRRTSARRSPARKPTDLIKPEVQKAAPSNAVIQVIAEDRPQNNEVAAAVGIQTSELAY